MKNFIFENAEWIWHCDNYDENEYAEFFEELEYNGKNTTLHISVCGDYVVFINGKYVASNQYADFPHYKVYDEINISDFLEYGKNTICFLVWYFGKSGMRYVTPNPGLIYEIISENKLLAYSSENTFSRKSKAYKSGVMKKVTPQLGYGFFYDAKKEDAWLNNKIENFKQSYKIAEKSEFYKRPTKKLSLGERVDGKITQNGNKYIVDLGEEIVGLLDFSFKCKKEQTLNILYGEVLENGHVKRVIGHRDFCVNYATRCGENEYCNYMFRFACRYIEIESEEPIDINYVGIIPQLMPVKVKNIALDNELDRKIYDICINTLKLCMMEHYVDCPWREQCLYAFDSRNQMLFGYSAFEGGNTEYAKANLRLISKDNRSDELLSICIPSAENLTIPSFSLYYILAVKEYLDFSGDLEFGNEVFEKLKSILNVFANNVKNDTVYCFTGKEHWNFYDWSPYAYSNIGEEKQEPDFLLNCIVIIALNAYSEICGKLNKENIFDGLAENLRKNVRKKYYNSETGLFFINNKNEEPTEIANSLAIISDVAIGELAEMICEKLNNAELIPCSLSMKNFKYDALLKVNKDKYSESVLNEIRQLYKTMLDAGSTTAWETIEGAAAFDNAGSLCHGWSAVPIYYYNKIPY